MIILPVKGQLQQWSVKYVISGAMDGTSLAPSADKFGVLDEEGVYNVTCDDLGIIDPDLFGGRGAFGDRFISFINIETNVGMPVGFAMSIVDASLASPNLGIIETRRITTPALVGTRRYVSTECWYVPQGQALRVTGMPAPAPGTFHRVTIGVRAGATGDDEARLASACCCQSEAATGGAQPAPPVQDFSSLQSFDFSTELIAIASGGNDAYFAFSSTYTNTNSELGINNNTALSIQPSQGTGPSALRGFIKMAMRAGSVTAVSVRTVTPFSARAFIEIDPGTGVFTRTFLMPAGVALAANTTTELTITPVAFALGDRIRVGLDVTAGSVNTALEATVEITTPAV